jgi:carboxyl-terminal processing protease
MRTLSLILFFIAVPLAGGTLKPQQEAEFWKGSGATLPFARTVINDQDCSSSENYFNSCRQALLVGAKLQKVENESDFIQLKAAVFPAKIQFERILAQLVNSKSGLSTEWLVGRMINSQLKFFDAYAQLSPRSYTEHLLNGDNKTYYGTGIEAEVNGAGLFVFQILPASPAESAGLMVSDQIVALNGQKIDSLIKAHLAAPSLSGRPGDKVVLDILRDGERFQKTLLVGPVVIPEYPSVELSVESKRFLQIRIRNFHRGTCKYLSSRIDQALAAKGQSLEGIILDLRHNRGGLVSESECIVRLFTKVEKVVGRELLRFSFPAALDFEHETPVSNERIRTIYPNIKLVVLINSRSASAAEIAAGALQDFDRALVVGERSYGKGTTQLVHNLENFRGLNISKTVSRYIRPSGLSVHGVGVTPNFEVPFRADAGPLERRALREEDIFSASKIAMGERWSESRTEVLTKIRKCMGNNFVAQSAQRAILEGFGNQDHQAAVALAVLLCH